MNPALLASGKGDWETPAEIFDPLNQEFAFTLDVCATKETSKCRYFFGPEQDSLSERCRWRGVCWMNPPYGRGIAKWVAKARDQAREGSVVVCLLPARTDTAWWHEHVIGGGAEVRFLRGRIVFRGAKYNAPFPSAVVIFRSAP